MCQIVQPVAVQRETPVGLSNLLRSISNPKAFLPFTFPTTLLARLRGLAVRLVVGVMMRDTGPPGTELRVWADGDERHAGQ